MAKPRKTFTFTPSARLQRYLGNELIADPSLAIIEFVKNSYDAGAANVTVDFQLAERDPEDTTLVIADDGVGMDEQSFEANWMHPGFSLKSLEAPKTSRSRRQDAASRRQTERVPVGEKGLGRLAAGRLGDTLEVFTRERRADPWLHVLFDWRDFEDMTRALHEIRIPYDTESEPGEAPVDVGTLLIIRGLKQKWDGKVRGRPVPGRSRTRLGRLKQDLQLLVRPLDAFKQDFTIHLLSDSLWDDEDIGTITPQAAVASADYSYSFEFRVESGGQSTIRRELCRSQDIHEQLGGALKERLSPVSLTATAAKKEERPATLESGPFRGVFLYTPPPAARRAKEIDAVGSGVLLYRDGLLVEPYGLDNDDWVGVAARKAQRQGYAIVQPATFSGYVLISRDSNPDLRDMSNRQGLLRNEASEAFIDHVRAEFAVFEKHIFEELSQRWEAKEKKAARQAIGATETADVRLRAVAHSLGQPLLGLAADIAGLKRVAKRTGVHAHMRDILLDIAGSAEEHLGHAEEILRRFLDIRPIERTEVSAAQLVASVATESRALSRSLKVNVVVDEVPDRKVLVARDLVLEALKELVRNALEAPRPTGRAAQVRLTSHESDAGDLVVDVVDNATGIKGANGDHPLSSIRSTKGRPGQGLATVETSIQASLGHVRLSSTGRNGTHIEVYLPDRVAGLRAEK